MSLLIASIDHLQWEKDIVFALRVCKMTALEMEQWAITEEWKEACKEMDRKIQEVLEPDRANGKKGVKFNFPDSKVRINFFCCSLYFSFNVYSGRRGQHYDRANRKELFWRPRAERKATSICQKPHQEETAGQNAAEHGCHSKVSSHLSFKLAVIHLVIILSRLIKRIVADAIIFHAGTHV